MISKRPLLLGRRIKNLECLHFRVWRLGWKYYERQAGTIIEQEYPSFGAGLCFHLYINCMNLIVVNLVSTVERTQKPPIFTPVLVQLYQFIGITIEYKLFIIHIRRFVNAFRGACERNRQRRELVEKVLVDWP